MVPVRSPGWTTTTVHTYHEGTIIIDIIDDRFHNEIIDINDIGLG